MTVKVLVRVPCALCGRLARLRELSMDWTGGDGWVCRDEEGCQLRRQMS